MRISTNLGYADDPRVTAAKAQALEAAGVDRIWIAEAYGFDAVSMLGYLAATTTTVELGSGILPLYSRTPALLAQTAAGLDALSNGRFVLGLGASGPQVIEGWHGVPYDRPVVRLAEIVEICRSAWRRERLVHDGPAYRLPLPPGEGTGLGKPLKLINRPVRERIPIHLASLGPRSVEQCAAIAEGWLPFLFVAERAHQVWGDALARGLARRDPALGPLDISAGGLLAIGPMAEVVPLRERARKQLALYIGGMGARGKNFYNDICVAYGWEAEAKAVQDRYLAGDTSGAEAALPDELVELSTLCGDEAYLRDRIAALREAGVTSLMVNPVGTDPASTLARLRALVD